MDGTSSTLLGGIKRLQNLLSGALWSEMRLKFYSNRLEKLNALNSSTSNGKYWCLDSSTNCYSSLHFSSAFHGRCGASIDCFDNFTGKLLNASIDWHVYLLDICAPPLMVNIILVINIYLGELVKYTTQNCRKACTIVYRVENIWRSIQFNLNFHLSIFIHFDGNG